MKLPLAPSGRQVIDSAHNIVAQCTDPKDSEEIANLCNQVQESIKAGGEWFEECKRLALENIDLRVQLRRANSELQTARGFLALG